MGSPKPPRKYGTQKSAWPGYTRRYIRVGMVCCILRWERKERGLIASPPCTLLLLCGGGHHFAGGLGADAQMLGQLRNERGLACDLAPRELVGPDDERTDRTRTLHLEQRRGFGQIVDTIQVVLVIGDRHLAARLRLDGARLELAVAGPVGALHLRLGSGVGGRRRLVLCHVVYLLSNATLNGC